MTRRVGDVGEDVRCVVSAVRIGVNGEALPGGEGETYFGGWLDDGMASLLVRSKVWQNG
jgi:hypothetical protein